MDGERANSGSEAESAYRREDEEWVRGRKVRYEALFKGQGPGLVNVLLVDAHMTL